MSPVLYGTEETTVCFTEETTVYFTEELRDYLTSNCQMPEFKQPT